MDAFDTKDLSVLTSPLLGPCASIFLSTHPADEASQQDRLRLRNLLDQAEEQLVAGGTRPASARDLLRPARQLPEDPNFWNARSLGLAIFIGPDTQRYYRLPVAFEELAIVGPRFIIRPLLPLFGDAARFHVLALSQNKVQFFEATRQQIQKLEISGLPVNMDEALNFTSVDRGSQTHSAMKGRLGKQAAVFHGQGGEPDTRKEELESFFRLVDGAIGPELGKKRMPLMLAGVDYLLPIYRGVSRYENIVEPEVHGNCDYLTPHEIHERAWQAIEPVLGHERQDAAARFQAAVAGDKALSDVRKILLAASEGRVEALFIDQDATCWGMARLESHDIQIHEQREQADDDLLDLAAVETLRHSGKVYAVPRAKMPVEGSAAALLRY